MHCLYNYSRFHCHSPGVAPVRTVWLCLNTDRVVSSASCRPSTAKCSNDASGEMTDGRVLLFVDSTYRSAACDSTFVLTHLMVARRCSSVSVLNSIRRQQTQQMPQQPSSPPHRRALILSDSKKYTLILPNTATDDVAD